MLSLVLNGTLDLCLSIADVVFWQGLAIYISEMLELGSVFPVLPHAHGAIVIVIVIVIVIGARYS